MSVREFCLIALCVALGIGLICMICAIPTSVFNAERQIGKVMSHG